MTRSHLTTHVLEIATGTPMVGVSVVLHGPDGQLGEARTDQDGRVERIGPDLLPPGVYTLEIATGDHYAARGIDHLYPSVLLRVHVDGDPDRHWHLPVLIGPFAYSTYRGS